MPTRDQNRQQFRRSLCRGCPKKSGLEESASELKVEFSVGSLVGFSLMRRHSTTLNPSIGPQKSPRRQDLVEIAPRKGAIHTFSQQAKRLTIGAVTTAVTTLIKRYLG